MINLIRPSEYNASMVRFRSSSAKMDDGPSRALSLDYKCDKMKPAIMAEVTCSVKRNALVFAATECCWLRSGLAYDEPYVVILQILNNSFGTFVAAVR